MHLSRYSGEKTAVYSIVAENSKKLFIEHFNEQYKKEYLEEVIDVMGRLKQIGQMGARDSYFKMNEGLQWNDLVCALYDLPDKHLRLCMKRSLLWETVAPRMSEPGRMTRTCRVKYMK